MKLAVVIPALNEEQSIASIIERTLQSRSLITSKTLVSEVDIVVVSDGSTDRTAEIANEYSDEVRVIEFPLNRGYGAAIQEGWHTSDAELLAFLDADGTCDPEFFVSLCNLLEKEDADIALGCRMNPDSKMPAIRRLGNRFFSILLFFLSAARVRDTASGMRVIRRRCLNYLLPLPTGLHFTPAMTARAAVSNRLRLVEADMPYSEREGTSKLSVLMDGLRFLRIIIETTFLYRPARLFNILALVSTTLALIMMIQPIQFYLGHQKVEEWMIYRFIASHLCGTVALSLYCGSYLSYRIVCLALKETVSSSSQHWLAPLFESKWAMGVPALLCLSGVYLVWPSLVNFVQTGHVYEHWSRFIVMSFFITAAILLIAVRPLRYSIDLIGGRLIYLKETEREHPDSQEEQVRSENNLHQCM